MGWGYMKYYVRVKPSVTCCAGYRVVHLLSQIYDNPHFYTWKSRYFVAPQLRCSLIFSLYARVKPNASFAVAWFPSSLQKSLLKVSLQKANKRVTTSVSFRAHTRNLSKYRSFRYSSAITGGTCRSLSPVTSVRCSKAIFQVHSIHPSQTGHFHRSELFLLPCP